MATKKKTKEPAVKARKAIHLQLQRWLHGRQQLREWEAREIHDRIKLARMLNPELMDKGGRERFDLGVFEVVADVPINTKVDPALVTVTLSRLPAAVRSKVLRYKPELVAKVFGELSERDQRIAEGMLIRKPGTVQIEATPVNR